MEDQIKTLLVCDNNQIKNQLLQQLRIKDIIIDAIASGEVQKEIDRISPDIILLVESDKYSSVELVHIQDEIGDSGSPVLLFISYKQNFLLLRDLIRIGITDYFVLPEESSNFLERLSKMIFVMKERSISQSEVVATGNALKKGKGAIYSFYSGKGGVGCSLLSTLYAQTMKFESTADILYIDLNLQYGGAEKFLGVENNRSIADLLPVMEELNENHLHNVVVKEPFSKMDLLLSPRDAEIAEQITEEHIVRLLRTSRRAYDIVVIDLPSYMDPITFAAIEESEAINYVLSLDTPAISNYKQVLDIFKRLQMDTKGRLQIVINRIDRNNELTTSDIKEFIMDPITAKFKEDKKGVQPLINKGEPLRKEMKQKKLPGISKQVRKWVLTQLK